MKNLLGVGVLVVCLLSLSPLPSLAQPSSQLLHRMVSPPDIERGSEAQSAAFKLSGSLSLHPDEGHEGIQEAARLGR